MTKRPCCIGGVIQVIGQASYKTRIDDFGVIQSHGSMILASLKSWIDYFGFIYFMNWCFWRHAGHWLMPLASYMSWTDEFGVMHVMDRWFWIHICRGLMIYALCMSRNNDFGVKHVMDRFWRLKSHKANYFVVIQIINRWIW